MESSAQDESLEIFLPLISLNSETKMCTDLDVWFSVLTSKLWNTHRLWPWAPAGLPIHSQQQACYECNKALVKIMGLRDLKKVVRLFHIYFLYFLHVAFFCCSCFWAGGRSCCLCVDVICAEVAYSLICALCTLIDFQDCPMRSAGKPLWVLWCSKVHT